MRAIVLTGFDGPDSLVAADVPEPGPPGAGEVAVEVATAGVGAWDLQAARGGFLEAGGRAALPQVAGWDLTGVVTAVGAGTARLRPGDAVLGFTPQPWSGSGAFAERVVLPEAGLARRPDGLDIHAAALLPVAALTARLLLAAADCPPGGTLLVVGAAGAVGGLCVQLAAARGITVVACVHEWEGEAAARRGAAHVVHRDGDVAAQARMVRAAGLDAAVDLSGDPAAQRAAVAAVGDGGRVAVATPRRFPAGERGITVAPVSVQPDGATLEELAVLAARRVLTPQLGHILPLEEGARAHRAMHDRSVRGRVVLEVRV